MLQRSLEDLESVLPVALEALLSSLPVDDLPDILNVCSLAIEVLINHRVSRGIPFIKTLEEKRLTCK
jgi:hypothetical protein